MMSRRLDLWRRKTSVRSRAMITRERMSVLVVNSGDEDARLHAQHLKTLLHGTGFVESEARRTIEARHFRSGGKILHETFARRDLFISEKSRARQQQRDRGRQH